MRVNLQAVGERLFALRGARSREEVAMAVGISVDALTLYELGLRAPRDEVKLWLSAYYGVPMEELFFRGMEHVS